MYNIKAIGFDCWSFSSTTGIIISLNEVFGDSLDILVLASPPRLPVDPDDVNTLN